MRHATMLDRAIAVVVLSAWIWFVWTVATHHGTRWPVWAVLVVAVLLVLGVIGGAIRKVTGD